MQTINNINNLTLYELYNKAYKDQTGSLIIILKAIEVYNELVIKFNSFYNYKDYKSIEQFKKIIEYYIKVENIKDIKQIVSFIRKMEKYNLMMKIKNNNLKYC